MFLHSPFSLTVPLTYSTQLFPWFPIPIILAFEERWSLLYYLCFLRIFINVMCSLDWMINNTWIGFRKQQQKPWTLLFIKSYVFHECKVWCLWGSTCAMWKAWWSVNNFVKLLTMSFTLSLKINLLARQTPSSTRSYGRLFLIVLKFLSITYFYIATPSLFE